MFAVLSIPLSSSTLWQRTSVSTEMFHWTDQWPDLLGSGLQGACLHGTFWVPLCEHFLKQKKSKIFRTNAFEQNHTLSLALEDYLLSSASPSQWSHQMKGLKWSDCMKSWCWHYVYLLMCTVLPPSAYLDSPSVIQMSVWFYYIPH